MELGMVGPGGALSIVTGGGAGVAAASPGLFLRMLDGRTVPSLDIDFAGVPPVDGGPVPVAIAMPLTGDGDGAPAGEGGEDDGDGATPADPSLADILTMPILGTAIAPPPVSAPPAATVPSPAPAVPVAATPTAPAAPTPVPVTGRGGGSPATLTRAALFVQTLPVPVEPLAGEATPAAVAPPSSPATPSPIAPVAVRPGRAIVANQPAPESPVAPIGTNGSAPPRTAGDASAEQPDPPMMVRKPAAAAVTPPASTIATTVPLADRMPVPDPSPAPAPRTTVDFALPDRAMPTQIARPLSEPAVAIVAPSPGMESRAVDSTPTSTPTPAMASDPGASADVQPDRASPPLPDIATADAPAPRVPATGHPSAPQREGAGDVSAPIDLSPTPDPAIPVAAAAPPAPPPFDGGTAPMVVADVSPTQAAMPSVADAAIATRLTVARDGQWLDQLARDIARTATRDGELRFQLNPEHLGSLAVEMRQTADGTALRLSADTEAARQIIADAQPKLVAEAKAHGVRIAEAHVDLGGGRADAQGRQPQQHQPQPAPSTHIRREPAENRATVTVGSPLAAKSERYA